MGSGCISDRTAVLNIFCGNVIKGVPVTDRLWHRVGRGIALLFHDHGNRRSEWSAARSSRPLPPGKTRYPFYRRLGESQGRSGRAENLYPPGFDPRTVRSGSPVAIPTGLPTHLLQHGIGQNLRKQVVYNRGKLSY